MSSIIITVCAPMMRRRVSLLFSDNTFVCSEICIPAVSRRTVMEWNDEMENGMEQKTYKVAAAQSRPVMRLYEQVRHCPPSCLLASHD